MDIFDIKFDFEGVFKERPNRYLAKVELEIEGNITEELVHVHDPGRLTELLYPGNKVLIRRAKNEDRKTKWDIIAAKAEDEWIVVNSAFHRGICEAILKKEDISPFGKIDSFKAEVKYGEKSRLDFLVIKDGKEIWVESKGCTLSVDKIAIFPDAPTKRGKRHLEELIEIKESGKESAIIILVLRDSIKFKANEITDPEFTETFYKAIEKGVKVYPILLEYINEKIVYKKIIPVEPYVK